MWDRNDSAPRWEREAHGADGLGSENSVFESSGFTRQNLLAGDWEPEFGTVASVLAAVSSDIEVKLFAAEQIEQSEWWSLLVQPTDQVDPVALELAVCGYWAWRRRNRRFLPRRIREWRRR